MTYEQIFSGRMVLLKVQRHVAQAHVWYPSGSSDWIGPKRARFVSEAGREAFQIVENAIQTLEREFDSKRRTPKQRRAINQQVLQK